LTGDERQTAMPELPEVETVRRWLEPRLAGRRIVRIEARRRDLRAALPDFTPLAGTVVDAVARRAKYLLIRTPDGGLLVHLGMTGTFRELDAPRVHDHVLIHRDAGTPLVFNDPRRFGLIDALRRDGGHACLDALGPEPLDEAFDDAYLAARCRGRRTAIKALIMDQAVVVGIGNIYAQEALFRAGIRPGAPAGRVSTQRLAVLVRHLRAVLRAAIRAGGSTISDFHAGGDDGWFQHDFRVYGRGGQPCRACGAALVEGRIGGRGTTWCRGCQR
jgi:formamidopyrimidine-DNA glycosylase